jgi:hypothetical protein
MSLAKRRLLLVAVASLILGGCLSGGGGGDSGTAATPATPPTTAITTADFFKLAVVPDQTVSSATFEVQVIAENIDPATSPSAPVVVKGGVSTAMILKTLQWPGTAINSVTVFAATIPLTANQVNSIKVVSGTKEINFSIRHKAALSVSTASNAPDLVAKIQAAMTDPSIDVVEIGYNEPDLGAAINNAGNGITSTRATWLTVRPAIGQTVSWIRNAGAPIARPMVDFLHIDQVTFGSDTSDGDGGTFLVEVGKNAWLSNVEFRAKYKFTWPLTTPMTANSTVGVRVVLTEGQKVYYTDCLWDGTTGVAITAAELARDLRFNSHRGDINNFGKVFLNAMAQDITDVTNAANTDVLHNDGFQIFGNTGTSDLVFKGLKIISVNIGADIQPFLLDKTFAPNYSNILLDSVTIEGAVSALNAQFAGLIANSRVSNFSFPSQSFTLRKDFVDPNGAFSPTNVRIHNFNVKSVLYVNAPNITYTSASVANPLNAAPELNANPGLAGAIFSNIKLN